MAATVIKMISPMAAIKYIKIEFTLKPPLVTPPTKSYPSPVAGASSVSAVVGLLVGD